MRSGDHSQTRSPSVLPEESATVELWPEQTQRIADILVDTIAGLSKELLDGSDHQRPSERERIRIHIQELVDSYRGLVGSGFPLLELPELTFAGDEEQ